eukprot:scaffold40888_cov20-Tisochrysis_lutea.AAC.1
MPIPTYTLDALCSAHVPPPTLVMPVHLHLQENPSTSRWSVLTSMAFVSWALHGQRCDSRDAFEGSTCKITGPCTLRQHAHAVAAHLEDMLMQ